MNSMTGEAFVFDVCSFYGHNEYDTSNWGAPRHVRSNKAYISNYKRNFPVSQSSERRNSKQKGDSNGDLLHVVEEDWDARNLLYSLTFNIGNMVYIPGSAQRQV